MPKSSARAYFPGSSAAVYNANVSLGAQNLREWSEEMREDVLFRDYQCGHVIGRGPKFRGYFTFGSKCPRNPRLKREFILGAKWFEHLRGSSTISISLGP